MLGRGRKAAQVTGPHSRQRGLVQRREPVEEPLRKGSGTADGRHGEIDQRRLSEGRDDHVAVMEVRAGHAAVVDPVQQGGEIVEEGLVEPLAGSFRQRSPLDVRDHQPAGAVPGQKLRNALQTVEGAIGVRLTCEEPSANEPAEPQRNGRDLLDYDSVRRVAQDPDAGLGPVSPGMQEPGGPDGAPVERGRVFRRVSFQRMLKSFAAA